MKNSWNPQKYDKFKNERSQPFFDLMSLVQPEQFESALDLGCGTGELTKHLHESFHCKKTLGVDNSQSMLSKAQALSSPGLSFELHDITNFSSVKPYDLIFSNAALQWCDNHAELLTKLRGLLNKHGQIAIQMPMNHTYPTHVIARNLSVEMFGSGDERKIPMLSPDEYATLLFQLGFQKPLVKINVYGHILESQQGVLEWVQGTLLTHYQSRLSESNYQAFLNEYKKRLFAALPDTKPFFYPFQRIFLWGSLK